MGVRCEVAGIAGGPGLVGGVFSSIQRCEEVGGGAEVVLYLKELVRTDNGKQLANVIKKTIKMTYLACLAVNGTLVSVFAFFPLPCPPLYGSVCVVLRLGFSLAHMTLAVSDHEPWFGATFFSFGKTCVGAVPAKRRSRRLFNCCRESVICFWDESWVRTASL